MPYRRAYMSRSRLVERPPEEGSRKWLVEELDRLTSLIVRKRDKRCVTCGSVQSLQCSHFYSRRYLSIRFDLRNCNAMCAGCNRRHNRDRVPYEKYMLKTYGLGVIAELDGLRMGLEKETDEGLKELLKEYEIL
ncbi:MAG: recombination protein NinG [Chitinophagaceae bacterium]